MSRLIRGLLYAGLAVVFAADYASADLILNGSFELPGTSNTTGFGPGREQYTAASQGLTSWTVSGPGDVFLHKTPDIGNDRGNQTFNFAEDGNFYLDLSGSNLGGAHATLYQDFATTPGILYVLKFYVGASNETPPAATINVQLAGAGSLLNTTLTPLAPLTNINWSLRTFRFVADSTTTRLSFHDTSGTDDNASFVDNVSVEAVPEPSSLVLLGLGGLAGVGYGWRRRVRRSGSLTA